MAGDTTLLENTSTGANRYLWDFGDGTTSTTNAKQLYHAYCCVMPSGYAITLTAYDDKDGTSDHAIVGSGMGPERGALSFWFAGSATYGPTVVAIGSVTDTIKSATGIPGSCGVAGWPWTCPVGCANFQLSPGAYNYSATELTPGTHTWSGSVIITRRCCVKLQLL